MPERLPKNLRRRASNERDRDAAIEAFEGAPDAPESLRERVAIALLRSDTAHEFPDADIELLWPKVVSEFPIDATAYRRLADAAIAVICTPVDGAE